MRLAPFSILTAILSVSVSRFRFNSFLCCLQVFTTVGTEDIKNFLLQRFPQLKPENILNSRSSSFEPEIMKLTGGRGVNMVLNSLAGDKLQASVRTLAKHGRFLEIGKFDLSNNTALGMSDQGFSQNSWSDE